MIAQVVVNPTIIRSRLRRPLISSEIIFCVNALMMFIYKYIMYNVLFRLSIGKRLPRILVSKQTAEDIDKRHVTFT